MKRDLATRIVAQGYGDSGGLLHSSFNGQPNGDGCFNSNSGLSSFQTVSSLNLKQTPFRAFHGSSSSESSDYAIDPCLLGLPDILTSDPAAFQQKYATPYSIESEGDQLPKSVLQHPDNFQTPKPEPLNEEDRFGNFGSQHSYQTLMLCNSTVHHLSVLRSLNQVTDHENQQVPNSFHLQDNFSVVEPHRKSLRLSTSIFDSWTLDGNVSNLPLPNLSSFAGLQPQKGRVPQSNLARMRRKEMSAKTLCLKKLLPWEKKMDTATMLEETYKYIKFLKAQISVLESMPSESSFTSPPPSIVGGCARLEKLNRQQLLQVLVNSPVVQTILSSNGCCVVSLEQLLFTEACR